MDASASRHAASSQPRVSIVIPLFNRAGYVAETLESVSSQTMKYWEVIVVDDGSSDDGPDVVRRLSSDSRIRLLVEDHAGIGRTRNKGAQVSSEGSEFLAFLDSDDVWHGRFLEVLVDRLERRPDAAAAFALAELIDGSGRKIEKSDFAHFVSSRESFQNGAIVTCDPTADVTFFDLFASSRIFPTSCLLVRRSAFEQVNGYDPDFAVAQDWDLIVRLARVGPLVPVNEVLVRYRRHLGNVSNQTGRYVGAARMLWAKTFYSEDNSDAQVQQLSRIWRVLQRKKSREQFGAAIESFSHGRVSKGLRSAILVPAHLFLFRPPRAWRARSIS